MKRRLMYFSQLFIGMLVCVLVLTLSAPKARAAAASFITWKARNFTPPAYTGKAIPLARGTTVDVNFELIRDGKGGGLGDAVVKFFVNNAKHAEGVGLHQFRFTTSGSTSYDIRVIVLGNAGNVILEDRVVIPTTNPEVTITPQYPRGILPKGATTFTATPYFFNISDISLLRFRWQVNGETPPEENKGRPEQLALTIPDAYPSNQPFAVRVALQNFLNVLEFANADASFQIK